MVTQNTILSFTHKYSHKTRGPYGSWGTVQVPLYSQPVSLGLTTIFEKENKINDWKITINITIMSKL